MSVRIARVAVAAPLHSLFDYRIPAAGGIAVGSRVRVPFGHARAIGVVTALLGHSEFPAAKLKPVEAVLDVEPLLQQHDIDFLTWVAGYYHHPPGEVIAAALPLRLRKADQALKPGGRRRSGADRIATGACATPGRAPVLAGTKAAGRGGRG